MSAEKYSVSARTIHRWKALRHATGGGAEASRGEDGPSTPSGPASANSSPNSVSPNAATISATPDTLKTNPDNALVALWHPEVGDEPMKIATIIGTRTCGGLTMPITLNDLNLYIPLLTV